MRVIKWNCFCLVSRGFVVGKRTLPACIQRMSAYGLPACLLYVGWCHCSYRSRNHQIHFVSDWPAVTKIVLLALRQSPDDHAQHRYQGAERRGLSGYRAHNLVFTRINYSSAQLQFVGRR
jgi:hypothetical protein